MGEKNFREQFKEQGYVISRGFFSEEEMTTIIEDIKAAEPKDGESELNKGNLSFYSNIFFRSKKLQEFISQPKVVDFLKQIIGPDIWVRWDQAVAKGPGAGTFPWHQDNAYSRLKDNHYQLWIALTKMTPENGGLWLKPGSHKSVLPHKRLDSHMMYDGTPDNPVFIEAKAGDIVLFSSLTLHSTTPNVSQDNRWAYVVEYMSLDHFDPFIDSPYLVVARDGKPQSEFVSFYRGRLNIINHLKYPTYRRSLTKLVHDGIRKVVSRGSH